GVTVTHAYAAPGAYTITLRASDGKATSAAQRNVTATAPPPPAPFSATFGPYGGNAWWVQTTVTANQPVARVCACVNGGACQALKLQSWGAWAASIYAPTGAKVAFTATATTGQAATSASYRWPVK